MNDDLFRRHKLLSTLETFFSAIQDNIFILQSLGILLHERGNGAVRLFRKHGGQMLFNRLSSAPNKISKLIHVTVETLIEKTGPVQDDIRERYTRDICDALTATACPKNTFEVIANDETDLESSHADRSSLCLTACAATGELDILRDLVNDMSDLYDHHTASIFPCPLNAAVANGKIEVVKWVIASLSAERGFGTADLAAAPNAVVLQSTLELSIDEEVALYDAFDVAAFKLQKHIGIMLLACPWLQPAVPRNRDSSVTRLVGICIAHGNISLLLAIIQSRESWMNEDGSWYRRREALTKWEWNWLMECGTCRMFEKMLDAGIINAEKMGCVVPLHSALYFRRYDLVRILLSRGTDVNVCALFDTPLLQVVTDEYFVPHVQILIELGANPGAVKQYASWPVRKTYELCKRAARLARSAISQGDMEAERQGWREIWQEWKDDGLLKRTWVKYEEISAELA